MAASWRELAQRPGIELHVIHPKQLWEKTNPFLADPLLLQGISNDMFDSGSHNVDQWLLKTVAGKRPHIVVLCGWVYRPYSRLVRAKELEHVSVLVGMDSPWRGTWRQRLARFRLGSLVRRLSLVVTSGERSSEYARRIGVPQNRIRSGFYGFNHERFDAAAVGRSSLPGEWPRQFLFVGRYVPQKGLDTLMKAYAAYHASVVDPWGLTCCGYGDSGSLLQGIAGVTDAGFMHPDDLPSVLIRHGAFILPSRFEPWGVVIAEAAASGLPVICTTACGAGVDLVRPYYNGLVVPPDDVAALSRAMRWIHDHELELPTIGRRGQMLAAAYSADAWATRWHNYFLEVLEDLDSNRSSIGR